MHVMLTVIGTVSVLVCSVILTAIVVYIWLAVNL